MPSRRSTPFALLVALLALLAFAPAASAAQRLIKIQTPSRFVDPDTQSFNELNGVTPTKLEANVLLPDGYAANPRKRWPLLLLLHGAGDNFASWADPAHGNIRKTAKGLP